MVFDSNAIRPCLTQKTGQFLPPAGKRGKMLSWPMFVASGIGPCSGQAVHFRHSAPGDTTYPRKRHDFEARRHRGIVAARLSRQPWTLGDACTIVDMALRGRATRIPVMPGEGAQADFPAIARFIETVNARPAALRAQATSHAFKTEMDEAARRGLHPAMFAADPA